MQKILLLCPQYKADGTLASRAAGFENQVQSAANDAANAVAGASADERAADDRA